MDCDLKFFLLSKLGEMPITSLSCCQLSLSRDVASGLAYIHSKHIIHRDLCGDNILLRLVEPVPIAKISDFGMSRLLNPTKLSSTLTAMGHRMGYLPPEAPRLEEEQYDSSLDVFSLGVIMVQIVRKLETIKSEKDRSLYVAQIPETHVLKPLITKCLEQDRSKRPSASQVCGVLVREQWSSHIWQRGKNMPIKMGTTVQSVVIGDTVYVGGGTAGSDRDNYVVMKLDLQQEQWTTLPRCNVRWFAMTSLNDQLILAGGRVEVTGKQSKEILVLNKKEKWTQPYPPMNTARSYSTAVSFNNHIIVAGGWDGETRMSSVELFEVTSQRWYIADPLPTPRNEMKSVLIGSTLYLMGGKDHKGPTKAVDIVDLIENAKTPSQATPTLWHAIQDTPLHYSTPLSIRGSLFAVGGRGGIYNPGSAIFFYEPDTRSWVEVGKLPSAQYDSACSVLPSGEIIVAGGYNGDYLNTLHILSFT